MAGGTGWPGTALISGVSKNQNIQLISSLSKKYKPVSLAR